MKVEMIMNGTQQIVLVPETDLEIAFLQSFAKINEIQTVLIDKQSPILDKMIHNGLIINSKKVDG